MNPPNFPFFSLDETALYLREECGIEASPSGLSDLLQNAHGPRFFEALTDRGDVIPLMGVEDVNSWFAHHKLRARPFQETVWNGQVPETDSTTWLVVAGRDRIHQEMRLVMRGRGHELVHASDFQTASEILKKIRPVAATVCFDQSNFEFADLFAFRMPEMEIPCVLVYTEDVHAVPSIAELLSHEASPYGDLAAMAQKVGLILDRAADGSVRADTRTERRLH